MFTAINRRQIRANRASVQKGTPGCRGGQGSHGGELPDLLLFADFGFGRWVCGLEATTVQWFAYWERPNIIGIAGEVAGASRQCCSVVCKGRKPVNRAERAQVADLDAGDVGSTGWKPVPPKAGRQLHKNTERHRRDARATAHLPSQESG